MIRGATAAIVSGVFLALAAPVALAVVSPEHASLEDCAREMTGRPDEERGFACAWKVARIRNVAREAAVLLEGVLASDPANNWARLYLGAVEAEQNHDRGETLYRQALAGFERAGNLRGQLRAAEALAFFCKIRGRLTEEDEFLNRARGLARRLGDPVEFAEADKRWGWRCINRGALDEASDIFRDLRRGPRFDVAPLRLQLQILDGNATADWLLGRFDKAMQAFGAEFAQAEAAGFPWYAADVSMQQAQVALDRWRRTGRGGARAKELLLEALERARSAENLPAAAKGELALAGMLEHEQARAALRRAGEILSRIKFLSANLQLEARIALLDGLEVEGQAEPAVDRLLRLATAPEVESKRLTRLGMLSLAAKIAWRKLPPPRAIELSGQALAAIEEYRRVTKEPQARMAVFSNLAGLVESYIDYLLSVWSETREPSYLDKAFAVGERYRAQELRGIRAAAGEGRFSSAPDGGEAASILDVQQALEPGEALVAFMPVPPPTAATRDGPSLWATWITASSAGATPLLWGCDPGCLAQRVELLERLVRRRDGSETAAAERLFGLVLAPVLADMPPEIHRLIAIPAGSVRRLPLHLLRPADGRGPAGTWLELSTAPSATIWIDARRAKGGGTAGLLSVVDPLHTGNAPLRAARYEAAALRRALGARTIELRGGQATASRLRAVDTSRISVVHIAAHAKVDHADPSRTVLLLAEEPGGSASDDAEFNLEDLAGLSLSGKTVLLAACESAGGAPITGEDLIGLAHAAFRAGARTVLGSLWPVRDDEAAIFIADLAREIGNGATLARALRRVRTAWDSAGRPAETWAAMVVIGDDLVVPAAGRVATRAAPRQHAAAATAFLLLLVGGTLMVRWTPRKEN